MKKAIALLLCLALAAPALFASCNVLNAQSTTTPTKEEITTPAPKIEEGTTTKPEQEQEPTTPPQEIVQDPARVYANALYALSNNDLERAYELFLKIADYGDVSEYLARFAFRYTDKVEYTPHGVDVLHYQYDAFGKVLRGMNVSSYGNEIFWGHQYNLDQKPTVDTTIYDSGNSESRTYEYDEAGNLVRTDYLDCVTTLEYDDKGNIIKSTYYDTVVTYAYDEEGRMTRKELITANVYAQLTLFEYDDAAHQITKKLSSGYVGELRLDTITVSTYDENGNLLKRETEQTDKKTSLYEFAYNEDGKQTKEQYKDSSGNEYLHLWEYDGHGNMTKHSYNSNTGWITPYEESYTHEYDAQGNIIKKVFKTTRFEGEDVSTYQYDKWGNVLQETHPGESDSPNDYRIIIYRGYKLYYNPYPVYELPEAFFGK